MKKLSEENKLTIQFILGVLVVVSGLVLLFLGFFAVPLGEIAPSVLTAFGEAATFSGALIGVDYKYRFDRFKTLEEHRHRHYPRQIIEENVENYEEIDADTGNYPWDDGMPEDRGRDTGN